jgi:hypothetical protein
MYGLPPIRLNRKKLRRALVIVVASLAIFAAVGAGLCWFFGIHSRMDVLAYRAMKHEHYPPIWKDLAWRRIRKGDSLEDLLQMHPPVWREDYGPYVHLSYIMPPGFNWLGITAQDGKLIAAVAGSCTWRHVFFNTPEEEEALSRAYSAYLQQRRLEAHAFAIHRAVTNGQDVFWARVIERRQVADDSRYSKEVLEDMRKYYGADNVNPTRPELTVEVTSVLYGDLQPGTVLTFPGDECARAQPGQPEPVFLHLDDMRLIYHPQYPAREIYLTVPRQALDWYQSLTEDQIKEFEARCLAERAERLRQEEQAASKRRKAGGESNAGS